MIIVKGSGMRLLLLTKHIDDRHHSIDQCLLLYFGYICQGLAIYGRDRYIWFAHFVKP